VVAGVLLHMPGAATAVVALTTAFVAEIFFLHKAGGKSLTA
jgi:hypothetical protein